jgi:hypothetical protein
MYVLDTVALGVLKCFSDLVHAQNAFPGTSVPVVRHAYAKAVYSGRAFSLHYHGGSINREYFRNYFSL